MKTVGHIGHFETVQCSLSITSALTRCGRFRRACGLQEPCVSERKWTGGRGSMGLVGCGKEDLVQMTGFFIEAKQIGDSVVFYVFILFPLAKTGLSCIGPHFSAFMGKAVSCESVRMLRWVCLHGKAVMCGGGRGRGVLLQLSAETHAVGTRV